MAPTRHAHPRLPGNDYRQGPYFVTLCTRPRRTGFGRITGSGPDAVLGPSALGTIVLNAWQAIPDHFPHVHLDAIQLMPDHLHAILTLDHLSVQPSRSTRWVDATVPGRSDRGRPRGPLAGSLGAIIGASDRRPPCG